jgi:ABC-type transport system involved in multi-copper enzyme maturation permease subunit
MLRTLIWKELLDHLLSLRFTITCLLCFFVMLNSFLVRSTDYEQVLDDYGKDAAADKAKLENATGPWDIIWGANQIRRPPNPLKVFVRGVSANNGAVARLNSSEPAQLVVPEMRSSTARLFPSVDMVAFVGLIMSLMAILFGYDAICGEKQNGTLRLMLSYSVPRDKILLAKWIGGFLALIVPFLFAMIAMAAIIMVQQSIALTDDQWMRLLTIFGLSVLYLAVIYTMALCVSCLTSRPDTSIMLLVTVWVMLFLALPNLAPHAARGMSSARGVENVEADRREKADAIWRRVMGEPGDAYDKKHGFGENWWESIDWNDTKDRIRARKRHLAHFGWEYESFLEQLRMYEKVDDQADADPTDEVWQHALHVPLLYHTTSRWASKFCEGKTDFHIAHHNERIYIAMRGYEQDLRKLSTKHIERDSAVWGDDCVELVFDPLINESDGYQFCINPAAALYDQHKGNAKHNFQCDIAAKVYHDRGYWAIEFAIDAAEFHGQKIAADTLWALNLMRARIGPASEHTIFWPTYGGTHNYEYFPLAVFEGFDQNGDN